MQPSLVFIPGNMCDEHLWSELLITEGHPKHYAPLLDHHSITEMAVAVLAGSDGLIIPVGFSMGGIVALEMARQAPERVAGLILIDTNAGADLPERAAMRPLQQARIRAGELATIVADELKPNYLAAANQSNGPLKDLLFDMAMGLGDDVFVAQSEALRTRPDLGQVLDDFAGPVLLMCGAEDTLCPPEWHHAMAARCNDATLNIIDGAGHMVPLEQPATCSSLFNNWLKKHKGRMTDG